VETPKARAAIEANFIWEAIFFCLGFNENLPDHPFMTKRWPLLLAFSAPGQAIISESVDHRQITWLRKRDIKKHDVAFGDRNDSQLLGVQGFLETWTAR
jgi:hypothetical protein